MFSAVLTSFLLVTSGRATPAGAADTTHPPNIIIIMTDDQGYGDLGIHGNPIIKTPNLDAMARRSARMEKFYVSPVCTPTRASLMTGRYNYRTRAIDTNRGRAMMDPEERTAAEILGNAGYATGIFGKWHLGDEYPLRPTDQGFGEALVHRGGGIGWWSDPPEQDSNYTDPVLYHNGEMTHTEGYVTDVLFDHALQWIEAKHRQGRPFFAYIPTNVPHKPLNDPPQEEYEYYKSLDLDKDQFPQDRGHELTKDYDPDQLARIYAMITDVDENVGRLFNRLGQLGITDNTIVIFMVDNGPNSWRYVAGYRGKKQWEYEGGIRSPFFVHWPAQLQAGQTSDRIAAHIDVLPTILDAADVALPKGLNIDGRSLLPLLKGQDVNWPDRELVFQWHRGDRPARYHNFAIRSQRWKLLNASGGGRKALAGTPDFELYDMKNDPFETRNVASEHPGVVKKMREAYDEWFTDVSHTRLDNYTPPRIFLGAPQDSLTLLTRQDWRCTSAHPCRAGNRDAVGYWLIRVVDPGSYTVRFRFKASEVPGLAQLEVGAAHRIKKLEPGATSSTFRNVRIPRGKARFEALLMYENNTRGVYQVDVIKQ